MKIVKQKAITVILSKGKAAKIMQALVHKRGLNQADVNFARGVGRLTPLRHRGIGETSEKEVITVAVDIDQADDLFEYIYRIANINQPHGGLMYMHDLAMSSQFVLPDLPEEH